MSAKRNKRILNEIKDLQENSQNLENNGIYFYFDESDINTIYAMLYGPEGTPYAKGFYFFKFTYPENYPMTPPLTKYCTQGYLSNVSKKTNFLVRFNPNLYTCGKVCLSMLNTWAGPGWVPTNTITNVMIAIQGLVLNDYPLTNEPGFEKASIADLTRYNDLIQLANIKIAVMGMIKKVPNEFGYFQSIMERLFIENIEYYRNFVLQKNDYYINLNAKSIDSPAYGMSTQADYSHVLAELLELEETLANKNNETKEG